MIYVYNKKGRKRLKQRFKSWYNATMWIKRHPHLLEEYTNKYYLVRGKNKK